MLIFCYTQWFSCRGFNSRYVYACNNNNSKLPIFCQQITSEIIIRKREQQNHYHRMLTIVFDNIHSYMVDNRIIRLVATFSSSTSIIISCPHYHQSILQLLLWSNLNRHMHVCFCPLSQYLSSFVFIWDDGWSVE